MLGACEAISFSVSHSDWQDPITHANLASLGHLLTKERIRSVELGPSPDWFRVSSSQGWSLHADSFTASPVVQGSKPTQQRKMRSKRQSAPRPPAQAIALPSELPRKRGIPTPSEEAGSGRGWRPPGQSKASAPALGALWTELDPGRELGGVAVEGAWLRAGGGSWGCQSAPAAAAARTPGLRSRLSPAQVRPPRCSAVASLGTAVRVRGPCQRRAAQGAGPRPPLPHDAPRTLTVRTLAGMRGRGFALTPVPSLRWRAVLGDPAQPRAGKVC